MRCFLGWVVVTVTALTAPMAMAAEWGDLKVRFVYGGDPPEPAKIQPTKDAAHCGQHDLVDESLLVGRVNRVELEIAPDMNDLGEIMLPAELFRHEIRKLPSVETE